MLDTASIALAVAFQSLLRHHVATLADPLPPPSAGITWIWGRDGLYKRGSDPVRSVLVKAVNTPPTPGLAALLPGITWAGLSQRLPGQLLQGILIHARKASEETPSGLLRVIEQQYHITLEDGRMRVRVPPQDASPAHVHYENPDAPVLLDLHSHHQLDAFFSETDNRDDTGLGVSAVIGRIFTRPKIICRLCCYGHTQVVPALTIFEHLGPFQDAAGREAR